MKAVTDYNESFNLQSEYKVEKRCVIEICREEDGSPKETKSRQVINIKILCKFLQTAHKIVMSRSYSQGKGFVPNQYLNGVKYSLKLFVCFQTTSRLELQK